MKILKNALFLINVAAAVFIHCSAHIDNFRLRENILKTTRLPGLDVCGKNIPVTDERVTGGRRALLGEFPWMAIFGYNYTVKETNITWFCGGSLITDQYVITAAHCFKGLQHYLQNIVVRLGELNLDANATDNASPKDFMIKKLTRHEHFYRAESGNDIALIKLTKKVNFIEKRIIPICLPPPEFLIKLFEKHHPIVAGWGKTNFSHGYTSKHLMTTEVEIKNIEECRHNITSLGILWDAVIDNRVICASSPRKDTCTGDSGGPLMFYKRYEGNGNIFLMGIVSYGYGCAEENYPGVYVRVAEYMSWIIDNLEI